MPDGLTLDHAQIQPTPFMNALISAAPSPQWSLLRCHGRHFDRRQPRGAPLGVRHHRRGVRVRDIAAGFVGVMIQPTPSMNALVPAAPSPQWPLLRCHGRHFDRRQSRGALLGVRHHRRGVVSDPSVAARRGLSINATQLLRVRAIRFDIFAGHRRQGRLFDEIHVYEPYLSELAVVIEQLYSLSTPNIPFFSLEFTAYFVVIVPDDEEKFDRF
ncbi:hypothetical protein K438DRAFT_1977427 [Mycena galopus ATCC 62051]|nr:hypothetical protein K438DRAFT_1977427 [Mycena galopus ATCC 62051]